MATFEQHGIRISPSAAGNVKVICPSCTPHNRKPANKNSKDLSVNITEGVWNCHNCGWTGSLRERSDTKVYTKPAPIESPVSEKLSLWFKNRCISERTLKAFNISEKKEYMPQTSQEENCACFPYIKNDQWVNIKFRDGKKNFKMVKDAELCIFNFDGLIGKKTAIITEGEIDCMSVFETGYCQSGDIGVCSVPNGATKGNQNLSYLDNSWEAFNDADQIILAVDNDAPGLALKNELARRLGKYRCREVIYPEGCKDLNEVLVAHGAQMVISCLKNSKSFPLDGIYTVLDFNSDLDYIYENGFQSGVRIGYDDFDTLLNFSLGQLTVITGVPNSGKSAFTDQILLRLASRHKWKFGICSFEKQPVTLHISDLMSCYAGKPFYRRDANDKMQPMEYVTAKNFINSHFFWFKMKDEDSTTEGILSRALHLVKSQGINGLLIDPYNYMDHRRPHGVSETEYISGFLTELCNFAKENSTHIFLVAHPTKIKKGANGDFEVPSLYDISGSAHFFNKTDNGIVVYRDRMTNRVDVYVKKVRFFMNGKLGYASFGFDPNTNRYKAIDDADFFSEINWGKPTVTPPFHYDNPRAGFDTPF